MLRRSAGRGSERYGGRVRPPRSVGLQRLLMTCSGVFRRMMFVAYYVHDERSWETALFSKRFRVLVPLGARRSTRRSECVGAPVTVRGPRARRTFCSSSAWPAVHTVITLSSPPLPCQPPLAFILCPSRPLSISFRITHWPACASLPLPPTTCSVLTTARPLLMWPHPRSL